jgi:gluconokinase
MQDIIIIMGPAGVGKSTIATALSKKHGWAMIEADDHHPVCNKDKMAAGISLTDQDRIIWIDNLVTAINEHQASRIVLACSALTPYVQGRLIEECKNQCQWILPILERSVLKARLKARKGHFMPASQIDNQLASLIPPKNAIKINANQSVEAICADISSYLNKKTDQ